MDILSVFPAALWRMGPCDSIGKGIVYLVVCLSVYSANEISARRIQNDLQHKKMEDLASAISNKKVQENLRDGLPYPYTEQDGTAYISAMLSADENETFSFAITAEGNVIGSIGVFRQGNIHRRTAELGYYIAEEYWGKGIMTEAVKQICRYVFDKSDIVRIYAEPFAHNAASCRVLEKAGFQYEGTLRHNAVKNGNILDMKMYSLLKTDI